MPSNEPLVHNPNNFINQYLRFTENQESPDTFHTWMAIGLIGAALARQVWIDMGYFKVYPNNYVVLCAGSAQCKKSTALGIGARIYREAIGEDKPIFAGRITYERLCQDLGRVDPTVAISEDEIVYRKDRDSIPLLVHSSELGVFLDKAAQNAGLPLFLTDIWECPERLEYRTKGQGTDQLVRPCLNMLAGTTPEWLQDHIDPGTFSQGLIGRVVFVYADKAKRKIAWPKDHIGADEDRLRDNLITHLFQLSNLTGEFEVSDDAKRHYQTWYEKREIGSIGEMTSGFWEREPVHVLKLAMIFAISAGSGLRIHLPHLTAAIDCLRSIRETMGKALVGAGFDASVQHFAYIMSVLARNKLPMTRQQLMNECWTKMGEDMFTEAMNQLINYERIQVIKPKNGDGGPIYYANAE